MMTIKKGFEYIPEIEWEDESIFVRKILTELAPVSYFYQIADMSAFGDKRYRAIFHLERLFLGDRNVMFIRETTIYDNRKEHVKDGIEIALHRIEEKHKYPKKIDGFMLFFT